MDGPVLVLLHGQPGSHADWLGVSALLPGIECLALDRPGYGEDPVPAGGFAANAQWLLDQLDARSIGRAVLVGHSWGAGVALAAAARAPQRFPGLVLVAAVGPGAVGFWDRVLAAPVLGPALSLVAWSWSPLIARLRLRLLARLRGTAFRPERHVNWHVWSRVGGRAWRSFVVEQRALVRELPGLFRVLPSAPVLLLHDPADQLASFSGAVRLAGLLPDAEILRLDGGHQLPQRRPEAVARALGRFVAGLPAGAAGRDPVG